MLTFSEVVRVEFLIIAILYSIIPILGLERINAKEHRLEDLFGGEI